MDQEYGVMDALIPNVLECCPQLLKAKKQDPTHPTMYDALAGPYREEFLHDICNEISELESHNMWIIIPKADLPKDI